MRVVVIGANGQLGSDVSLAFSAAGDTVAGFTHAVIEVSESFGIKPESCPAGYSRNTRFSHRCAFSGVREYRQRSRRLAANRNNPYGTNLWRF